MILDHPPDSPLFLYLSFQAPHQPFQGEEPPHKYMKQYRNSRVFQQHLSQDKDAIPRAASITVKPIILISFIPRNNFAPAHATRAGMRLTHSLPSSLRLNFESFFSKLWKRQKKKRLGDSVFAFPKGKHRYKLHSS